MSFVLPENWIPQGIDTLEPAAWEALKHTDVSVCVTASAGAGKTEFLAQKAAYLLQTGICRAPYRILAISFKRDAAKNLSERVRERCPDDMARRFDSMTFDAFTKTLIDRFGPAIPNPYKPSPAYQISFPGRRDWEEFLRGQGAHGLSGQALSNHISNSILPIANAGLSPRWTQIVEAWWTDAYRDPAETRLAFPMLNRLSEYLLRVRPTFRRALRLTYPFIFLDEFQDTTEAQYDLLRTAFLGGDVKITAVGDDKQRIMGWAGAMPDGFDRLIADFNTEAVSLLSNWRSHEDLVSIQHVIARQIDEDSPAIDAKAERHTDGDVSAIWTYATKNEEQNGIASWIANEVQNDIAEPHEFALLVRMRADDVEDDFKDAFVENGLVLRNVARNVGGVAIQDILTEDLTRAVLPLLRLGATTKAPESWQISIDTLRALRAIEDDDVLGGETIRAELETCVSAMRQQMQSRPDKNGCAQVLNLALDCLDEQSLRNASPNYTRDLDYNRIKAGFLALLQECAINSADWNDALNRFEGVGQVPLMTVHKSKGLEFHTMIFLGLDDRSWWSLNPDSDEMKSFFVAFTRAMQRAFFTRCRQRGGSIDWLETLLEPAGVDTLAGPG